MINIKTPTIYDKALPIDNYVLDAFLAIPGNCGNKRSL